MRSPSLTDWIPGKWTEIKIHESEFKWIRIHMNQNSNDSEFTWIRQQALTRSILLLRQEGMSTLLLHQIWERKTLANGRSTQRHGTPATELVWKNIPFRWCLRMHGRACIFWTIWPAGNIYNFSFLIKLWMALGFREENKWWRDVFWLIKLFKLTS